MNNPSFIFSGNTNFASSSILFMLIAVVLSGCDSPTNTNSLKNQDQQLEAQAKEAFESQGYEITTTDLGTLGGDVSFAYDINNKGQIVGKSLTENGKWHAFL